MSIASDPQTYRNGEPIMNIRILRRARRTRIGSRTFEHKGRTIHVMAPRASANRWFELSWSVEGGKRGLDILRHRSLARAVARDLCKGTDKTGALRAV
jgi:hypothetical protein